MSLLLRFLLVLLCAAVPGRAEPAAPAAGLDRAALLASLVAELTDRYSLIDTLAVDLLRPWSPPAAAAGDDAPVFVAVVEYPEALASSSLVRVRFTQGERILREDTLALRVNLWREGLVAVAPLKRGESVSLQGLETRRVDVLRERDALPLSACDGGYVFARDLPAGRPLAWRDVSRRSLVRRGQTVEILAGDGALVITLKALAMQDGAQGDVVRVRNIESKREFTARVVAENRAEVRF